jgi:hypothetical protein
MLAVLCLLRVLHEQRSCHAAPPVTLAGRAHRSGAKRTVTRSAGSWRPAGAIVTAIVPPSTAATSVSSGFRRARPYLRGG